MQPEAIQELRDKGYNIRKMSFDTENSLRRFGDILTKRDKLRFSEDLFRIPNTAQEMGDCLDRIREYVEKGDAKTKSLMLLRRVLDFYSEIKPVLSELDDFNSVFRKYVSKDTVLYRGPEPAEIREYAEKGMMRSHKYDRLSWTVDPDIAWKFAESRPVSCIASVSYGDLDDPSVGYGISDSRYAPELEVSSSSYGSKIVLFGDDGIIDAVKRVKARGVDVEFRDIDDLMGPVARYGTSSCPGVWKKL